MFDSVMFRVKIFQARKMVREGAFESALGICEELREKTSQARNIYYAHSLFEIGTIFHFRNEYEKAVSYFQEAVLAYGRLSGNSVIEGHIALCSTFISISYRGLKNYDLAIKYAERSKDFYEKQGRVKHLCFCYCNLMFLYGKIRDYERFFMFLELSIRYEKKASRMLYGNMKGNIEENMREFLAEIRGEDDLGEAFRLAYKMRDIVNVDNGLHNIVLQYLCDLYSIANDYEQALVSALKSAELCERQFGKKHVETASSYLKVSNCYGALSSQCSVPEEAVNKSIIYGYNALKIFECSVQADTEKIIDAYNCMSANYLRAEMYEDAIDYVNRSLEVMRAVRKNNDPKVLEALRMLQHLHFRQKNYKTACTYAENILKLEKSNNCTKKSVLTDSYSAAVWLALRCGETHLADKIKEMMELIVDAPDAVLGLFQEGLRHKYFKSLQQVVGLCYSVTLLNIPEMDFGQLFDFCLKTHNTDAEISYAYSGFFRLTDCAELREKKSQVDYLYKEKMLLVAKGNQEEALARKEEEIKRAEIELLKMMDGSGIGNPFVDMHTSEIQKELKNGEILLEYVRFTWYAEIVEDSWYKEKYGVFAITNKTVQFLDIGYCDKIDNAAEEFIQSIKTNKGNYMAYLEELQSLLVSPFQKQGKEFSTVYIVPDSTLFIIPFELLLQGCAGWLNGEACSVVYLSSGREMMRKLPLPQEKHIFIVADPEYDICGDSTDNSQKDLIRQLPFTSIEAREIASLFADKSKVEIVLGRMATKWALTFPGKADILHISTHGFTYEPQRGDGVADTDLYSLETDTYLECAEDPFFRCGLLFAGAANWLCGKKLPESFGDGVLNGLDIVSLDLSKYKLVVLSACQTGLGEAGKGEGIKGLRRAFELAGAGFLVCTLWEVDDLSSAVLMRKFYEQLIDNTGTTPETALARAKVFVRNITGKELVENGWGQHIASAIDKLFEDGEGSLANGLQDILDNPECHPFSHPRYWAAYILQGRGI